MGTKRPFDEDLQEFIKHPKHIENGNKPDSFGEDKQYFEISQNLEISGEKRIINCYAVLVAGILAVEIFQMFTSVINVKKKILVAG